MRFVKMHGIGNDYIFVDCFEQSLPEAPEVLAPKLSDRHFGIGGDGLILILPSDVADARMRIFNADGSEAEMCGNGVRCVAKYIYERGLSRKNPLRIETGRGILSLQLKIQGDRVTEVTVDMGEPILEAARIPTTLPGSPVVEAPLTLDDGTSVNVTCVSMGNPHCVIFTEDLTDETFRRLGPIIEKHPAFPQRVNVEFVRVCSPQRVEVRVWERGSGETLACGTGACAVCVAGALTGRTERKITVRLPGGELITEWAPSGSVFMTGPATTVFTGEWPAEIEPAR
ncbi:diaminopimelate epimerase [Thermogutta terrifontis]|nr:diaminopimelate epimerase [Thermogutta terrifontis]